MKNYYFHLAKYFYKKNIKSIISFGIILLIATLMFMSAITINTTIDKDYDKKFDELNTANVVFTIPASQYNDNLINEIKGLNDTSDVDVITGIFLTIPVRMNDSSQDQNQIFYNKNEINKISKYNIIKETKDSISNPIYIPYYLYINSSIDLKDKYKFEINNQKYIFNIKGIVEEMEYGNYSSSVIGLYLENNSYNYLLNNNENKEVKTVLIKSNSGKDSYNEISKLLTKYNISILNKGYDESKKQSRLSVSNIIVLILVTFSIIILLISLFVTKFKIKETIAEDITNMGVLKELGYKNNEIIIGIIIPYILVTIFISLIGILLSIPVINVLSSIISSQAGFMWNPKLGAVEILITILINLILVVIFSYMSASKINKLNPINAIRGLNNDKFNKNYFRIDKTKGRINLILSLKNFANSISSNILLGIVLLFVMILSSFVVSLFYNVNINPMNFINTLVEEHPTIMIKTKEDIKEELNAMDEIDKIIYYDENGEVNLNDNSYKTFIVEDYKKIVNDLVYEGKNPNNKNEVAIGSSIKEEFDYKIGDTITISKNGNSNTYKIVGFLQSVNYSGEVIELTLDGYKKIDQSYIPNYLYIYSNDETAEQANKLIDNIKDKYNNKIESTINYVESLDSASSMFINLIKLITIIIIVTTLIIIYLILNILLSGVIQNKKQELGVLKSIGYKTKDLIYQIVGGFLPSTIIFIVLGFILSKLFMNNIFNFIFKMIGAYKVSFEYPLFIFVLVGLFLILSTIVIGILLCKKIKKITVYSLIKD